MKNKLEELISNKEINPGLVREPKKQHKLSIEENDLLEQQEKLILVGEFSLGVAHDINNFLLPAKGYLDLYLMTHKNDEDVEELFEVKKALEGISEMTLALLTYSKSSKVDKSVLPIYNIHNFALKLVNYKSLKNNIFIYNNFETIKGVNVFGNRVQLSEVYVNLLKNACEAIGKDGRIYYDSSLQEDQIVTRIRDTGHGIPADDLGKIFESFYTTKKDKGTGLGLSICRRIVAEHNGEITCESELNKGTTFTVKLPIYKAS